MREATGRGRGARRRVEGGARGDGSRAPTKTPTPSARARIGMDADADGAPRHGQSEFGDVRLTQSNLPRAARRCHPEERVAPPHRRARAMPAAPGDGGRVDATLPPREWESWVDEAECLWVALSAGKAARATVARRRPPPPQIRGARRARVGRTSRSPPRPSSRPWPAVKLFTTGGATDVWRPFSPFAAPFAARVASPRRPPPP